MRTTMGLALALMLGASSAMAQTVDVSKGGCFEHKIPGHVYVCLSNDQWQFYIKKYKSSVHWWPMLCTDDKSGSIRAVTCEETPKTYSQCADVKGEVGQYAHYDKTSKYSKANTGGVDWPKLRCEIK